MLIEIKSRTEVDGKMLSKFGKTTYVNDSDPKMKVETTAPKFIDSPPWHIEIRRQNWFYDGENGEGSEKTTTRKFAAYLTPADFAALLDLALPIWRQRADIQARKKVAFDMLHELNDVDLLSFLAELLPSRSSTKV